MYWAAERIMTSVASSSPLSTPDNFWRGSISTPEHSIVHETIKKLHAIGVCVLQLVLSVSGFSHVHSMGVVDGSHVVTAVIKVQLETNRVTELVDGLNSQLDSL